VRDPERIDRILDVLGEAWRRNPDLRLFQLLINAMPHYVALYAVEDDVVERGLVRLYCDWSDEDIATLRGDV